MVKRADLRYSDYVFDSIFPCPCLWSHISVRVRWIYTQIYPSSTGFWTAILKFANFVKKFLSKKIVSRFLGKFFIWLPLITFNFISVVLCFLKLNHKIWHPHLVPKVQLGPCQIEKNDGKCATPSFNLRRNSGRVLFVQIFPHFQFAVFNKHSLIVLKVRKI